MKKILLAFSCFVVLFTNLAPPVLAAVGNDIIGPITLPNDIPGQGVTNSTQAKEKLLDFVRGGIRIVFIIGTVGVLFYFAIGAIRWILSGGDKQQIDQAKNMITAAIVGFALLAFSYLFLHLLGSFFGIEIVQEPRSTPYVSHCPPTGVRECIAFEDPEIVACAKNIGPAGPNECTVIYVWATNTCRDAAGNRFCWR